jgi:ABC-2 type transport system ATP-binding protein
MIEIQGIRKSYNGVRALDGFSLRAEAGEIIGLVGPNGAGKTTLIKILSTLMRPDAGSARIAGFDVVQKPVAVRAAIGYMPDVPGLYQDMRVAEFLEFFAEAFRLRGERRRAAVEKALARSGLASRRSDFVEELSLGLKQRLVLAKTLLHEPKVLLLDEPATGLDPLARLELREQLKQLNREGATVLISSHILSDLENLCSRVALIDHGRNARFADESSVPGPKAPEGPRVTCDVEFLGDAEAVRRTAAGFEGAQVLAVEASRLRVELAGDATRAAAFLRSLIEAGHTVVRFNPREKALEDRYRQTFGGTEP